MFVILKQMFKDIKNFLSSTPKDIKYIALDDHNSDK